MFGFLKDRNLITLRLAFVFCTVGNNFNAQVYYSTRPDYLKLKTEQNNLLSNYKNSYPDSSITELSNYFPRNFLGNTGLPSPEFFLNYGTDDLGFRFFVPPSINDRFFEKQAPYYRSVGPYASLTGVAGSKQLQVFKLLFTQTYKEKVNITLRLNRYTSEGYYVKQQTYTNNFFLTSNYTTRNNRFGYYFFTLNNGNKNGENGGIAKGRITDTTLLLNKDLLRVKLNNAKRDNRETKVMVNPWFRLNRRSDSLHRMDHFIQLKSKFVNSVYRYKDLGLRSDKFYKDYYYDSTQTVDSSSLRQYINEISYSMLSRDNKFGLSAGYKSEISQLWQKTTKIFLNEMVMSDLVYRTPLSSNDTSKMASRSIGTAFNFQYVSGGTNIGNLKVENKSLLTFSEKKHRHLFFSALYEKRNPDNIYKSWSSNHFQWFNDGFRAQRQLQLTTGLQLGNVFSASVFYQEISGFLYFDNYASPAQFNNKIHNTGFTLAATKVVLKHLGLSLKYTHQTTTESRVIRLPGNAVTAKLFYNGNLFKNNLQLQIGTQLQVYEAFTSYAYMPSTEVFYLQDNFNTTVYPFVDVYLNARIRPVSFFLKVENLLQGYAGPDYAFVPGYYQPDRAFRFGITWVFFD